MATSVSTAVLRASADVILDQVRLARGPLDFTDALILMAITQANVEPILRDPALNREFATYDHPPPDALRRPISINAVSQSLGLPFETVRRRVMRLSKAGVYRITPAGVVVPSWVVKLGSHRAAMVASSERVQTLYTRLVRLDALPPIPTVSPWEGAPPLRAIARASAEYLLRLIAAASAELGDLNSAAIWLEVLRSTYEHLPERTAMGGPPRAVRLTALARRLGMPQETVRRRTTQLVARGVCEWSVEGLVLPAETPSRPEFRRISLTNHRDLGRMFVSLGQLGAVARWQADAEVDASDGHRTRERA